MPARTPEEICSLFKQYMAAGDIESVLSLYDREIAFLNEGGDPQFGLQEVKQELAPLAAARTAFDFKVIQVIRSGDIALMHTQWTISSPEQRSLYAINVARRQPDRTWRWLIGDPFTVSKHLSHSGLQKAA